MQNSKIVEYIKANKNWEEKLTSAPYHLTINKKDNYVLFMYNQILSNMSNPLVQEARGSIVDINGPYYVCRSYNKFFNYSEANASPIDWNSATIREKMDGSLMKIWKDVNGVHYSTNKTIDAYDAPANDSYSFGQLIEKGLFGKNFEVEEGFTYLFELIGPENRIVIEYDKVELVLLDVINNETGLVCPNKFDELSGLFRTPRTYTMGKEDVLDLLETLKKLEGFVVCDKYNRRIKMKTTEYFKQHRIRGNGKPAVKRVIEMIQDQTLDDFISVAPQYEDFVDNICVKLTNYCISVAESIRRVESLFWKDLNRKEVACFVEKNIRDSFTKRCCYMYMFNEENRNRNKFLFVYELALKLPSKNLKEAIDEK